MSTLIHEFVPHEAMSALPP